jgi:hypothetical protein
LLKLVGKSRFTALAPPKSLGIPPAPPLVSARICTGFILRNFL